MSICPKQGCSSLAPTCDSCKHAPSTGKAATSNVKCPVCRDVAPLGQNQVQFQHGQSLHFACKKCVDDFVRNPLKYVENPTKGRLGADVYPVHSALGASTSCASSCSHDDNGHDGKIKGVKAVTCPVCEHPVTPSPTAPRLQFKNGQALYFACPNCVNKFLRNPKVYMKSK